MQKVSFVEKPSMDDYLDSDAEALRLYVEVKGDKERWRASQQFAARLQQPRPPPCSAEEPCPSGRCEATTSDYGVRGRFCVAAASGRSISRGLSERKTVVTMKKMSSKNTTSIIGVRLIELSSGMRRRRDMCLLY